MTKLQAIDLDTVDGVDALIYSMTMNGFHQAAYSYLMDMPVEELQKLSERLAAIRHHFEKVGKIVLQEGSADQASRASLFLARITYPYKPLMDVLEVIEIVLELHAQDGKRLSPKTMQGKSLYDRAHKVVEERRRKAQTEKVKRGVK